MANHPLLWETFILRYSWCSPHQLTHCSILSHTVLLEVTLNHPYLYETTSKSHKDFIHFIQTRLNLWVHYLFGSFSSTRNNCTTIKRSLQNSLVLRYIHEDFFKMQTFQKNINRIFLPLSNLFSAFSLCNAIMSVLETGHTSRSKLKRASSVTLFLVSKPLPWNSPPCSLHQDIFKRSDGFMNNKVMGMGTHWGLEDYMGGLFACF